MTVAEYLAMETPETGQKLIDASNPLYPQVPEFLKETTFQQALEECVRIRYGGYRIRETYSPNIVMENLASSCTSLYVTHAYMLSGLYETTLLEYEPIENYRMTEKGKDTDGGTDKTVNEYGDDDRTESFGKTVRTDTLGEVNASESLGETNTTTSGEHSIAGYDQNDSFSPQTKDEGSETVNARENTTHTDSIINKSEGDEVSNDYLHHAHTDTFSTEHGKTLDHELTRYGNIGVTTSQQMLEAERNVRNFSIYDVIASLICSQFFEMCLEVL